MIKPIKTKKTIRQELDDEINRYLKTGGAIDQIDKGISGRETGANLNNAIQFSENTPQTRTPLTEEVRALEERKAKKTGTQAKTKPKKRIIYDDFGEPLREVWE